MDNSIPMSNSAEKNDYELTSPNVWTCQFDTQRKIVAITDIHPKPFLLGGKYSHRNWHPQTSADINLLLRGKKSSKPTSLDKILIPTSCSQQKVSSQLTSPDKQRYQSLPQGENCHHKWHPKTSENIKVWGNHSPSLWLSRTRRDISP